MATDESTRVASHHEVYDDLWRIFYAMRGCMAGANYLGQPDLETLDQLAGVLIALDRLAAEGERMAADARDRCPFEDEPMPAGVRDSDAPQKPTTPPAPANVLSPEAHAAIERKALALSLTSFEKNRAYMEDWLRRQPDGIDPHEALAGLHALDLDHGQYRLVNIQDFYTLKGKMEHLGELSITGLATLIGMEATAGLGQKRREAA